MRATLFPGQGTQRTGMSERFTHLAAEARAVYSLASDVTGRDVAALCFRSPPAVLRDTANAQTAITVTNLAAHAVALAEGFEPEIVAGHSVGEIAAFAAAGAIDDAGAIALAERRGALMGALPEAGTMAATKGLTPDELSALCDEASGHGPVVVAVVNGDDNVIVSGAVVAVEAVVAAARERGAKAKPLDVSHAFHSPLMAPIAAEWGEYVAGLPLRDARVPVVLNVTARPATAAADFRDELLRQVTSPVRWRATMSTLVEHGVTIAVEAGDSRVLGGFARAVEPPLRVVSLGEPKAIGELRAAIAGTVGRS